MGLHQGEGRPVIKSRGPRGEAEGVLAGEVGVVYRGVCVMRWEASWIKHGSLKAKRLDHEVRMFETR